MSLARLKKELRLIMSLVTEMTGNSSFAEDLIMLERHRRALLVAISIEHARRRRQRRARRTVLPAPLPANSNHPDRAA